MAIIQEIDTYDIYMKKKSNKKQKLDLTLLNNFLRFFPSLNSTLNLWNLAKEMGPTEMESLTGLFQTQMTAQFLIE